MTFYNKPRPFRRAQKIKKKDHKKQHPPERATRARLGVKNKKPRLGGLQKFIFENLYTIYYQKNTKRPRGLI